MIVKSNDGKITFDIRDDGSPIDWSKSFDDDPVITGSIREWDKDWEIEYEGGCDRCGCREPRKCMFYPVTGELYCKDCDSFNQVGFCEHNLYEASPEDIACCLLNKNGVDLVETHIDEIIQILNKEDQKHVNHK